MENDCIFCKVVKGELPSTKVTESEHFIVIKDVHPRVEGHSLVIPKEHYPTFSDLPKGLYQEFLETAKEAVEKLQREIGTARFNYGIVGELVPHFHFHIFPRKEGDGFSLGI